MIISTVFYILFSANIALCNPWGILMKVVGGIKILTSLGESGKEAGASREDLMKYTKRVTIEYQKQKRINLEFQEMTEKIKLNERAVAYFYNATKNSEQTVVFVAFFETNEKNMVGWRSVIFDDMEEYKTFLKKYNSSKKEMIGGILLTEYKIDIGPIDPDQPQQNPPTPSPAPNDIQPVAYAPAPSLGQ